MDDTSTALSASCIFCKIGRREIPTPVIYEDERTIAFVDLKPMSPGHSIVIPKAHAGTFMDMTDEDTAAVALAVRKVGTMIKKTFNPPKVGVLV